VHFDGPLRHRALYLQAFAAAASEGMIPNRFPDTGDTPDYNTVDATLWFFHAVARYIQATNDREFLQEIYPILRDALEWHWRGTRYGIAADASDGTLRCGDASTQLTWMDAKVGAGSSHRATANPSKFRRCGSTRCAP
jgi:predicted glycogen debranching enzyme